MNKSFSYDGSSHQTWDAAFTPAMPHDLQHSRANTDAKNSYNTQHTRKHKSILRFVQKDTQPSQQPGMFWMTHRTKPDPKIDADDSSLPMGGIN
jgi:hypothetical protein